MRSIVYASVLAVCISLLMVRAGVAISTHMTDEALTPASSIL